MKKLGKFLLYIFVITTLAFLTKLPEKKVVTIFTDYTMSVFYIQQNENKSYNEYNEYYELFLIKNTKNLKFENNIIFDKVYYKDLEYDIDILVGYNFLSKFVILDNFKERLENDK